MNVFVALCTIATLCFIRASALEEQDVEDLDLEMDMELARDLEDYDEDNQELKARPSKRSFCIRTKRDGWGGQCLSPGPALLNQSCDFIWDGNLPATKKESICKGEDLEKYCCVNCDTQKQTENCRIEGATAWRTCYPGSYRFKTMNSGCSCCGECKPNKRYCKKSQGRFCVTKNDPVCNNDYCIDNGGKTKSKTCSGKHCSCCIGAANPAGC